jgi:hypothetical protein
MSSYIVRNELVPSIMNYPTSNLPSFNFSFNNPDAVLRSTILKMRNQVKSADELLHDALDPEMSTNLTSAIISRREELRNVVKKMDSAKALPSLISTLWHSRLPCFDTVIAFHTEF